MVHPDTATLQVCYIKFGLQIYSTVKFHRLFYLCPYCFSRGTPCTKCTGHITKLQCIVSEMYTS